MPSRHFNGFGAVSTIVINLGHDYCGSDSEASTASINLGETFNSQQPFLYSF
jgi:hypothetical protein